MKRFVILATVVAVLAIPAAGPVRADVPVKINYRGWLDGYPAGLVTETLIFRLYDAPTSPTAIRELSKSVDIYEGSFSVVLEFEPSDFSGPTRYVGVFKEDGTTELTSARPQVTSVPYAYQAGNLYSTSDGKVGIGTTEPAEKLDVAGNIHTSGDLLFLDGIIQNGNVGIGTTSPEQALDVAGNIRTSGDLLFPDGIIRNGNVGIGTTSPTEKLHVVGNMRCGDLSCYHLAAYAGLNALLGPSWEPASEDLFAGTITNGVNGPSLHGLKVATFGGVTSDPYGPGYSLGSPLIVGYNWSLMGQNLYFTRTFEIDGWGNAIIHTGNVGIGTTSPQQALDVAGNIRTSGDLMFPDGIIHNGNIGIGTTGPAEKLHVAGNVRTDNDLAVYGKLNALFLGSREPPSEDLFAGTVTNGQNGPSLHGLKVATFGGVTSDPYGPGYSLGSPLIVGYNWSLMGQNLYFTRTFEIEGNGNAWLKGTLAEGSDARLKEDIEPLSDCLDKVMRLQGVTYNWRRDESGHDPEDTQYGFVGQEVHKVIPELAPVDEEGHYGIIYDRLIPVVVEAMKEQQSIIETQNSRLEVLEEQLKRLEEKMTRLEASQGTRN